MEEAKKTFEAALAELEAIVDRMEKGEMTLDESIEYYHNGMELSKYCSSRLDEVEKKITLLIEGEKGEIREEPFSPLKEVKPEATDEFQRKI